jgi:hypothetical protein
VPVPNIPGWADRDGESRALAVLEWCDANGIHTASIMDYQLDAAMTAWAESMRAEREETGSEYDVEASPMDYVHQIRTIAAFLRSRK